MRASRIILFAALAGCAHSDTLSEGVLRKGDLRVQVGPVPSGWRRVQLGGADLAFHDDVNGASVLFDVRCGRRDDDAPLSVLTDHLIMGTTDRDVETQQVVPFDGREAMHSLLRAKLDGVAMQYDIYVMKKDGCLYDLVYLAPPPAFAVGLPAFERFVAGVHARSPSVATEAAARSPARDR